MCFAALDCTSHTEVCTNNDVTGYPTFKYFNYGKNPQKYMGGREVSEGVGWGCHNTLQIAHHFGKAKGDKYHSALKYIAKSGENRSAVKAMEV